MDLSLQKNAIKEEIRSSKLYKKISTKNNHTTDKTKFKTAAGDKMSTDIIRWNSVIINIRRIK